MFMYVAYIVTISKASMHGTEIFGKERSDLLQAVDLELLGPSLYHLSVGRGRGRGRGLNTALREPASFPLTHFLKAL